MTSVFVAACMLAIGADAQTLQRPRRMGVNYVVETETGLEKHRRLNGNCTPIADMVTDIASGEPYYSDGFRQKITLFGVHLVAFEGVPLADLIYAGSVLGYYLDSNEDGVANDPNLIATYLVAGGKANFAIQATYGQIMGALKDSFYGITFDVAVDDFKNITIEEFHHGIITGMGEYYPTVFSGEATSESVVAVNQAYGDCEVSQTCAASTPSCTNYACNSVPVCTYPGAVACTGSYHYSDATCGCGDNGQCGCLVAEGVFWGWTTYYGMTAGTSQCGSSFSVCDRRGLGNTTNTALMNGIMDGTATSQATLGWVLPYAAPDGNYCPTDPPPTPAPTPAPPPTPPPTPAASASGVTSFAPLAPASLLLPLLAVLFV